MNGPIIESKLFVSATVLVVLYIIGRSNYLIFVSSVLALVFGSALVRLRYHFASGAKVDLVAVRSKRQNSAPRTPVRGGHDSETMFSELIKEARTHHGDDDEKNETIEQSGALLTDIVANDSTKYDRDLYRAHLDFDHRCFYVHGQPTHIVATDFDYWRMDVQCSGGKKAETEQAVRVWTRELQERQSLGFNAVRIRFHWGFHSNNKGKYDFAGSRNVSRLLEVCAELNMLVIACIGPFIGDDVQGGGFPLWLVQRKDVRLRHMHHSGWKRWDIRFAAACAEWYDAIVGQLMGHEVVTTNSKRTRGCVVLVQVENHLRKRGAMSLPLALQDETRQLARMARERVVRVPLMTNNLNWPGDFAGFWPRLWDKIESKLRAYRIIGSEFKTDVSGFSADVDLNSEPLDIDQVASVTRADNTPMVAGELRCAEGGYSAQIEAALRQGLTTFVLPDFFAKAHIANLDSASSSGNGGSAVGAGYELSADARAARLVLGIARSFAAVTAAADYANSRPWIVRTVQPTVRSIRVTGVGAERCMVRRQWELDQKNEAEQLGLATFVDGTEKAQLGFQYYLADTTAVPGLGRQQSFALTGTLGSRGRGIFVANLSVRHGGETLAMVAASKEVYARVALPTGEAWVCADEDEQSGQFFFLGKLAVSGHADVEHVQIEDAPGKTFTFVAPKPGPGTATVEQGDLKLRIVFVARESLDTLVVGHTKHKTQLAVSAAWGTDGIALGPGPADVTLLPLAASDTAVRTGDITVVGAEKPHINDTAAQPVADGFMWRLSGRPASDSAQLPEISAVDFVRRQTQFGSLKWTLLPTVSDLESMDDINVLAWHRDLGMFAYTATDVGFNAAHTLYRCSLRLKPRHLRAPRILLQLNARHRCTLWVNGRNMSGHVTHFENTSARSSVLDSQLVRALRSPGASNGPDRWKGTETYDVTSAMRVSEDGELNEVIVLVESFGVGAQANGFNDAHTPRGLIAAYWHGFSIIGDGHDDSEIHDSDDHRASEMKARWEVAGVDVCTRPMAYDSCGIAELSPSWDPAIERPLADRGWSTRLALRPDAGIHWWRVELHPPRRPLFLHVAANAVVYTWYDDLLVAKHNREAKSSHLLCAEPSSKCSLTIMGYGWERHADLTLAGDDAPVINVELFINDSPRN